MNRLGRYRPTPSMVVALLALFVALGGGAYAAIKLPPNSVGSRQLKTSAVTRGKLAKNAVTGAKVKNGSLTGADLNVAGLPKVPSATSADSASHAGSADSATKAATADNATHAGSADSATDAEHATNADKLGGAGPSAFQASTLPPGQTEVGGYAGWGAGGGYVGDSVTFPIPLAAALDAAHVHFMTSGTTSACPGSSASPAAASGHLCLYRAQSALTTFGAIFPQSSGTGSGADRHGFGIWFSTSGTSPAWNYGTWAVTG
jgi:hypothetical protein